MPLCSVLMSVYNEKRLELDEAIESVLKQSFTDFEFIIVCDNPGNAELIAYLGELNTRDNRVRIIYNQENMGLALSLNVAAAYATGKYIIRMDADDIAMPGRFQQQVDLIENSCYDLIWTSYYFINENDTILYDKKARVYHDDEISRYLPLENIIHHPTVIMKKSVFDRVGGYRKYPCAQDYDLWLRMLYHGCKMHMMPEKLLKYRVRENSTTNRKKYMQLCTLDYIRSIYVALIKTGKDIYSYDGYKVYLAKHGVGTQKIEDRFFKAQKDINDGRICIKKHDYFHGAIKYIAAIGESEFYRRRLFLQIRRFISRR